MTKQDHINRLCYKYSALATMNAENLTRRIRRAALGKSDPGNLAAKLLEIKAGANLSADAPEDEQIWAAVLLKQLPPRAEVAAAKADVEPKKPVAEPIFIKKTATPKSDDK
jgi:hypothetical protein